MNKKEIDKLEQEIKAVFNKIEEVKKGKLLFESNEVSYYLYKNKYYSSHTADGDCWCEEVKKSTMKDFLEEAIENISDETERVITNVRLNTLLIKELYEEKIKLLEIKL